MSNNTAENLDNEDGFPVHYLIQDVCTGEFLVSHEDPEFGGDQWAQLDVDAEDIGSADYLEEEVAASALFSSLEDARDVAHVLLDVLKDRFPGEEVDLRIIRARTVTTSFIDAHDVDSVTFNPDDAEDEEVEDEESN
jgi:hypothetical protein